MRIQQDVLPTLLLLADPKEQSQTLLMAVGFRQTFQEDVVAVTKRKTVNHEDFHHLEASHDVSAQQTRSSELSLKDVRRPDRFGAVGVNRIHTLLVVIHCTHANERSCGLEAQFR